MWFKRKGRTILWHVRLLLNIWFKGFLIYKIAQIVHMIQWYDSARDVWILLSNSCISDLSTFIWTCYKLSRLSTQYAIITSELFFPVESFYLHCSCHNPLFHWQIWYFYISKISFKNVNKSSRLDIGHSLIQNLTEAAAIFIWE